MTATDDASSHARPNEARITHLHWDATLNFDAQTIAAAAKLTVHYTTPKLRLDVKHLAVRSVHCSLMDDSKEEAEAEAVYKFEPLTKEHLGQCMEITLPTGSEECVVTIVYETSKDLCSAAQWLPPEQTAGRVYPYFFTQCQAIHARSLVPCQDCPGVKITYTASVTVPSWATCLMSALSTGSESSLDERGVGRTIFRFEQTVPVPAYLIAVVVGDLESRRISSRCCIWSEPSVVEAAAFEFSQTEEFLQIAESLTLPYKWGRYDVLCLPSSFPYGGMENPCLTFVTPTLLAGDKVRS